MYFYNSKILNTKFDNIDYTGYNLKSNVVYLKHIIDSINKIEEFTEFVNYGEFMKNNLVQSAVILNLEIIGETSKHIPLHIKERSFPFHWSFFEDLGNNLIQYYYEVDLELVWETTKSRLPELKTQVMDLLCTIDE